MLVAIWKNGKVSWATRNICKQLVVKPRGNASFGLYDFRQVVKFLSTDGFFFFSQLKQVVLVSHVYCGTLLNGERDHFLKSFFRNISVDVFFATPGWKLMEANSNLFIASRMAGINSKTERKNRENWNTDD